MAGNNFFVNAYLAGRYFIRGERPSILKSNLEGQLPIFNLDLRGYTKFKYWNFNLDFFV